MNKQALKEKVAVAIEKEYLYLQKIADDLSKTPELGYREKVTASKLKKEFEGLGLNVDTNVALTGFKTSIKNLNNQKPKLAILGELDSIICHSHPLSNKATGAAHACGHFMQLVSMLAVAKGFYNADLMKYLPGEIIFMAVPAEEFIELDYRETLVEKGLIRYKSGKQQAVFEGHFDDIDIVLMNHILSDSYPFKSYAGMTSNAFISKRTTFIGCEAHAGAEPHKGINALSMATLALNNINALRDTFREEDKIRIHSIIADGGSAVNVIPSETVLETVVRASSLDALAIATEKVDRCIAAAAIALGGEYIIKNDAGYLPLVNNKLLIQTYTDNMESLLGRDEVTDLGEIAASFDFGDLTYLRPGLHSFIAAAKGSLHSKEFKVQDTKLAYVTAAQGLAFTVIDLLYDDALLAKKVMVSYHPKMNKKRYLQYLEQNSKTFKSDFKNTFYQKK